MDLGGSDSEQGSPGKPDGRGRKQMNTAQEGLWALVASFNLPPCSFLGRPGVGIRDSGLREKIQTLGVSLKGEQTTEDDS